MPYVYDNDTLYTNNRCVARPRFKARNKKSTKFCVRTCLDIRNLNLAYL